MKNKYIDEIKMGDTTYIGCKSEGMLWKVKGQTVYIMVNGKWVKSKELSL